MTESSPAAAGYLKAPAATHIAPSVGSQHQVDITQLPPPTTKPVNDTDCHGTLVYSAKLVRSMVELNRFLDTVASYFYHAPHLYNEELTLQLLHQCKYDIAQCRALLEPIDDELIPQLVSSSDDEEVRSGPDDVSDDSCAVCGEGGELIICDYRGCMRVYHQICAGLTTIPDGHWECSAHFCTVCNVRVPSNSEYVCNNCPTAYCQYHIPRTTAAQRTDILNTATNHNNSDVGNEDKQPFLCTRCRVHDDASNVLQERHTFLKQLQSILQQPSHPSLLQLYHEVQQRGGLQELLNGPQWRNVSKFVQSMSNTTSSLQSANMNTAVF